LQINNIILTSRAEGMVSLDWSLAELVKTNEVLLEDALQFASDPQQLRYMLRA
jgi:Tfp pilus assembly ATPase PilU